MYDSKEKAERAYKAYLAQKHDSKNELVEKMKKVEDILNEIKEERTKIEFLDKDLAKKKKKWIQDCD